MDQMPHTTDVKSQMHKKVSELAKFVILFALIFLPSCSSVPYFAKQKKLCEVKHVRLLGAEFIYLRILHFLLPDHGRIMGDDNQK